MWLQDIPSDFRFGVVQGLCRWITKKENSLESTEIETSVSVYRHLPGGIAHLLEAGVREVRNDVRQIGDSNFKGYNCDPAHAGHDSSHIRELVTPEWEFVDIQLELKLVNQDGESAGEILVSAALLTPEFLSAALLTPEFLNAALLTPEFLVAEQSHASLFGSGLQPTRLQCAPLQ